MAQRDDLSSPRGTPGRPGARQDPFGPAAERFARFFGTVTYLFWQTVIVIVWIILNGIAFTNGWDPYPFILLNLMFSTQAAYAAPLILLAQNRQADRERAEMERDRERNARALADMEFLARELSTVRLALEHKADKDDLVEPLERLAGAIEAMQPRQAPDPEPDRSG